jgi:hypothetical protein
LEYAFTPKEKAGPLRHVLALKLEPSLGTEFEDECSDRQKRDLLKKNRYFQAVGVYCNYGKHGKHSIYGDDEITSRRASKLRAQSNYDAIHAAVGALVGIFSTPELIV